MKSLDYGIESLLPSTSANLIVLKQIKFRNIFPNDDADLYMKITNPSSDVVPNLVIQVDGGSNVGSGWKIYDGNSNPIWNPHYTGSNGMYLITLPAGNVDTSEQDVSIKSKLLDNGRNQDSIEGKKINFDITFAIVPYGSSPHF